MAKIKTALGLMSGTSMDGIDIALVETDGRDHVVPGPVASHAFDAAFAQRISAALEIAAGLERREDRPGDLAALEAEITRRHGEAVARFLQDNRLDSAAVDVIGFHGQTVVHRPDHGLTVQLGNGAQLAEMTGIATVWDMRANDMENGGQGAPLVPVFHQALARRIGASGVAAFVNVGGIANVTFVAPDGPPVAFDCGPGNALIDQWMRANTNRDYDEDGDLARAGRADDATVDAYLADPFFARSAPKSLDRNDFSLDAMPAMEAGDGAATLSEITARSIAFSARTAAMTPDRWIVSGGGAHNRAIVDRLKAHLGPERVMTAEAADLSSDMMEAQAWAYLAVRSLRGLALTYPSTTGCEEPVTGGVLSLPGHGVTARRAS
ncbi:MAG: anhydro-N-acetylmuramic acid kinase [Roseitalea sp.]|nr:anhydro-N-acetylmuramic acid kinase [Roseitalea sp.]MBO6722236.1 anhydro-N-acetylmuramic acid kinase [Roseitalea sp.]MBO6744972.1 anhydro-N-acetylmuramic acid kinase [Roseitalea sp.]